jgi:pyridoxal phosphate enzyme (YggS family)
MPILDKEHLRDNLDKVIWNIEQARINISEHHIVKLVTVGKYTDIENIATLYHLGQRAFGENQIQQLKERSLALDELPLEWHMVGSVQKNKINNLIDLRPTLMHSLDSMELALELNKKLEAKDARMNCLLQINAAKEESKSGVASNEAIAIYKNIQKTCPNIKLKGVMTIGANSEDEKKVEKSFNITYDIYKALQSEGASICSMGMSGDYVLAIKCGSNLVRVGSALFEN